MLPLFENRQLYNGEVDSFFVPPHLNFILKGVMENVTGSEIYPSFFLLPISTLV